MIDKVNELEAELEKLDVEYCKVGSEITRYEGLKDFVGAKIAGHRQRVIATKMAAINAQLEELRNQ